MKCPQCGRKSPPNPLQAIGRTLEGSALLLLLSHVTPDPGFYTNWHWATWWLLMILAPIQAILTLIFVGAWLTDPVRYYKSCEHRS